MAKLPILYQKRICYDEIVPKGQQTRTAIFMDGYAPCGA